MAKSNASALTKRHAHSVLAPLRPAEARRAVKAATAAVVADAGTSVEQLLIFPPSLRIDKPPRRDAAPGRYVRVLIRDRDRRVFHDISVVGASGEIVQHLRDEGGRPPVSDEELREATDLIRSDRRPRALLARRGVELEVSSPAAEPRGRQLALRLTQARSRGPVRELAIVEVDLDLGEITEFTESTESEGPRSR